ncbi:MAG: hypothetical protein RLY93_01260 [Sumerlaeia bacterium]
MKILCLILVFVNVVLFGVAGFRLLTAQPAPARSLETMQQSAGAPEGSFSVQGMEDGEFEESAPRRPPPRASVAEDAEAQAIEDDYTFGDRNEYDVEEYLDEGDQEMKQEGLDDAKNKIQQLPFGKNR